jgi:UDP-hydrolysing UDP-N-acetyl-D-glucosamine 2-epimerase
MNVLPDNPQTKAAPADREWLRRIGCISTSRADAGIYRPLLTALAAERRWDLFCFAGGTHYAAEFGRTAGDLLFPAGVRVIAVDHLVPGDGPQEIAATAGRAVEQFSRAFQENPVDLVFVLGDRTEMLAAALAAVIHRLPIAHLHGGDITEGAYDEQCRHAITKLSHLHFPALPEHAQRILSMGEETWRVHTVGALALDALARFTPEPLDKLLSATGFDFSRPVVVVAFYPETLSDRGPEEQVQEVLAALVSLDADLLLIGPNADVGHARIRAALAEFVASRAKTILVPALPQERFWSCLARAALLVGNSSAGLLEAASFHLPVVNVGDRQKGRLRCRNVVDAPLRRETITTAIAQAIYPAFRSSLADLENPYGNGHAAESIVAALRHIPNRPALLHKRWADRCPGP